MSINAWPFLVSRSSSVDYKTIVAPDFIDATKLRSLLTKVTEGDRTPPNKAYIRWVQNSRAGDFSIIFRVVEARATDIGESSSHTLKDSFGRGIYLVEGLVVQKDPDSLWNSIESGHMEQVHTQVKAAYERFWYTGETTISSRFLLQEGASSQILELQELESVVLPPTSNKLAGGLTMPHSRTWKPITLQANSLPILITAAIVFILFSLFVGQIFGGAVSIGQTRLSQDCSYVTQLQRVPYNGSTQWLEDLKDLEEKHKPATLLISTVVPGSSSTPQSTKDIEEPTFKQERDGTVQMKFHPLQQAITQLQDNRDSKFANNTTLEVRMIKPTQKDNDQCLQSL